MTKEFVGYAFHKTLATGFIDMALLLANVSQLKILTEHEISQPTVRTVFTIVLVILSIVLQIVVGLTLIYLGTQENRELSTNQVLVTGQTNAQTLNQPTHKLYLQARGSVTPSSSDKSTRPYMVSHREVHPLTPPATPPPTHHTTPVDFPQAVWETDDGRRTSVGDEVDPRGEDQLDDVDGGIIIIDDRNLHHLVAFKGNPDTFQEIEYEQEDKERHVGYDEGAMGHTHTCMEQHSQKNARVMCCVFIIMIINILISGLGFSNDEYINTRNTTS